MKNLNKLNKFTNDYNFKLKTFYWSLLFKEFGKKSFILGSISVTNPEKIKIGSFCRISSGVILNGRGGILIGNHVRISHKVIIVSTEIEMHKNYKNRKHINRPIIIEDGVWIYVGATILPGVKIGKGSIIAAGAVVNKNVSPFTLVGGVPAKSIKKIEK